MTGGAGRQILGKAKDAYPSDGPLTSLLLIPLALAGFATALVFGTQTFVAIWRAVDQLIEGAGLFAAVLLVFVAVSLGLYATFRLADLVSS